MFAIDPHTIVLPAARFLAGRCGAAGVIRVADMAAPLYADVVASAKRSEDVPETRLISAC